jgi:hypothetical protein
VLYAQDGPYWHVPSRDVSVAPTFVKNADLTSPMAWLCVGPPPEDAQLDRSAATSAAAFMAAVAMDRRSINPPLGGGGGRELALNNLEKCRFLLRDLLRRNIYGTNRLCVDILFLSNGPFESK